MTDDQWLADQRIKQQHTGGGRCEECAPVGGCLALLAVVRRRTVPAPFGSRTTAVLLGMARPQPQPGSTAGSDGPR